MRYIDTETFLFVDAAWHLSLVQIPSSCVRGREQSTRTQFLLIRWSEKKKRNVRLRSLIVGYIVQ